MGKFEKIDFKDKSNAKVIDIFVCPESPITVDFHYHRSLEILLPLIGGLNVFDEGEVHYVPPGDLYIVNSKVLHQVTGIMDDHYYKGYVIQIPYATLCYCEPHIDDYVFTNTMSDDLKKRLKEYLFQLIKVDKGKYDYLSSTPLVLMLMHDLLESAAIKREKVTMTREQKDVVVMLTTYLDEHYGDDLDSGSLAKTLGYSYSYLERLFKENLKMPIKDYLTSLRLQHTEYELIHSNLPIIEISEKVGFPNVKSLDTQFKKKHHMTPRMYRLDHSWSQDTMNQE